MVISFITTRCSRCTGWGLVKKELFKCKICTENNFNTCTWCEFRKFKGSYGECEICFGSGEIFIDKQTKNRIYPECLPLSKKIDF